jgi:hypothetical protein
VRLTVPQTSVAQVVHARNAGFLDFTLYRGLFPRVYVHIDELLGCFALFI